MGRPRRAFSRVAVPEQVIVQSHFRLCR